MSEKILKKSKQLFQQLKKSGRLSWRLDGVVVESGEIKKENGKWKLKLEVEDLETGRSGVKEKELQEWELWKWLLQLAKKNYYLF